MDPSELVFSPIEYADEGAPAPAIWIYNFNFRTFSAFCSNFKSR